MALAIIHIGVTVAAGGARPFIIPLIGADGMAEQDLTAIMGDHFMCGIISGSIIPTIFTGTATA
jgi:hypothetical protein